MNTTIDHKPLFTVLQELADLESDRFGMEDDDTPQVVLDGAWTEVYEFDGYCEAVAEAAIRCAIEARGWGWNLHSSRHEREGGVRYVARVLRLHSGFASPAPYDSRACRCGALALGEAYRDAIVDMRRLEAMKNDRAK